MTTTIKSSFLIDDLLSAFKRPPTTNSIASTSLPTPTSTVNSVHSTKESAVSLPANDMPPISLNFFQPPNQFNQYAAIKPELHPFFFHGMSNIRSSGLSSRETSQITGWSSTFHLHVH